MTLFLLPMIWAYIWNCNLFRRAYYRMLNLFACLTWEDRGSTCSSLQPVLNTIVHLMKITIKVGDWCHSTKTILNTAFRKLICLWAYCYIFDINVLTLFTSSYRYLLTVIQFLILSLNDHKLIGSICWYISCWRCSWSPGLIRSDRMW
jgi:hypothetical protein